MSFHLEPASARTPLAGAVSHRDPQSGELTGAMKAALRGDWEKADEIEVDYLNLLVRISEFGVHYPDGEPHEIFGPRSPCANVERHPFVYTILRNAAPDGRSLLVWTLAEPCRRCAGLLRRVPCRICDGQWYVNRGEDIEWLVYSDLDGVLVREDLD